jgi:ligand-binding sensor domain-containing protein
MASQPNYVRALAAVNNATCYAATDAGLWRWRPGKTGGRWQQIAAQFAAVELLSVACMHDSIWVGAQGDIAVSRDAGESWGIATLPIRAEVIALAASPDVASDGIVLAATMRDGVLRSADGGATFHAWNFGLLDLAVNALAVSADFARDGHALAATDHGVYVSRNSGRAWRALTLPAELAPFTAVGFDGAAVLIGTESHGLWRMPNLDAPAVRESSVKATAINAINDGLIATASSVLRSDRGRWRKVDGADGALCIARCGDVVLASGDGPGVVSVALAG